MSARNRSISSNIMNNKNKKIFSKTVTSNFRKSSEKSQKRNTEMGITTSTGFSDKNKTNTIASSIRSISKFKILKKEIQILKFEDFHRKYIFNKNIENQTLNEIYYRNGFSSFRSNYISTIDSQSKVMNLKKKSISPSIFSSSTSTKSRKLLTNDKIYKRYNNKLSSYLSVYLDNIKNTSDFKDKNKVKYFRELCEDSNNNNNNNTTITTNNKEILHKSIINNLISFKKENKNEIETIFKPSEIHKDYSKLIKHNSNLSKHLNSKKLKNVNFKIISSVNYKNKENNKLGKNFFYMGKNHISLNDKLAYPPYNSYLFSISKGEESVEEFKYKTRLLSLDKYFLKINKDSYDKQFFLNKNNLQKEILKIKGIEDIKKLYNNYNYILGEYLKFLFNKFREVKERNELIKQDKYHLHNEIEKLKHKIAKNMNKIKEGLSIKLFIMCVKNHTSTIENFPKEDIKELEKDKLKLKEGYYLHLDKKINNNNDIKKKKIVRTNTLFNDRAKKIYTFTSSKKVLSRKIVITDENKKIQFHKSSHNVSPQRKRKSNIPGLIGSDEEFFQHLDAISTKIYNLIKEHNDKTQNITYLKMELDNIKKNSIIKESNSLYINQQFKILQQSLENKKIKNKELLQRLNVLKDTKYETEIKNSLVLNNILKIYNNFKEYGLNNIKVDDADIYGEHLYLKEIESFFLKMLDKVKADKIKFPNKYEELKQQIEKRKKSEAFKCFQKLLMQKLQIKIDNVLKKASKLIYINPRRKNDYKNYYKHFDKDKDIKPKKSYIEFFFEFMEE